MKLTLICAAYGEPYYPYIRWSSPTEGIKDYSTVALNDTSVVVTNTSLKSARSITISLLELCNVDPDDSKEYTCTAGNGLGQNISQSLLGNSSVVYSFANEGVQVSLGTEEVIINIAYGGSHLLDACTII